MLDKITIIGINVNLVFLIWAEDFFYCEIFSLFFLYKNILGCWGLEIL